MGKYNKRISIYYIYIDTVLRPIRAYPKRIEYILEGNLKNLSECIFSVPFSLNGVQNVHKLYAVEYKNTVCSLYYSFQFRNF